MLIATFGDTTAWVGKTITFENEQFVLEGHGPIVPSAIVEYDKQGHLEWSSDGLRKWVYEQAVELTPLAPPPAGGVLRRKLRRGSSAPSKETAEASDPPEASAGTAIRTDIPVATFLAGSAFADKTIVSDDGAFVIEGAGAVTAAEVMEFDRGGQLIWADFGTRAWVGSKAPREKVDPRVQALLDKARSQYERGKYKSAISTLQDLSYTAIEGGQLEAARGTWDLASEIGAHVDGYPAVECAQLVTQSRDVCRGGRVRVGAEAPEAAVDAADPSDAAVVPVVAPPLEAPCAAAAPPQATPPKANPLTRKQLDKAQRQYERGKQKAAVETLWLLDAQARRGDAEAARGIIELAGEMGTHVEGDLVEECADLVARSRKALDAALAPSAAMPAAPTRLEGNLGFALVLVGLVPALLVLLAFLTRRDSPNDIWAGPPHYYLMLVESIIFWAAPLGFALCCGAIVRARRQGTTTGLAREGAVIGGLVLAAIIGIGAVLLMLGY